MMPIPQRCKKLTSDPLIKFEQNQSNITFDNKERKSYYKVKIDGDLFPPEDTSTKRCDELLESCQYKDQYFVELKGSEPHDAEKQLEITIGRFGVNDSSAKKTAYVVLSRNRPTIDDTHTQMMKKMFKKRYTVTLVYTKPGKTYLLNR